MGRVVKYVIQRRVWRRGEQASWKTISEPMDYISAIRKMAQMPIDSTRLLSGIAELMQVGAIQRTQGE